MYFLGALHEPSLLVITCLQSRAMMSVLLIGDT